MIIEEDQIAFVGKAAVPVISSTRTPTYQQVRQRNLVVSCENCVDAVLVVPHHRKSVDELCIILLHKRLQ